MVLHDVMSCVKIRQKLLASIQVAAKHPEQTVFVKVDSAGKRRHDYEVVIRERYVVRRGCRAYAQELYRNASEAAIIRRRPASIAVVGCGVLEEDVSVIEKEEYLQQPSREVFEPSRSRTVLPLATAESLYPWTRAVQ